ncbi:hypothetical protein MPSEU_000407200 [Mayamaea pseudoterrestris]|nr:hypothetical protein MPSEU_000407200 [Mayamaea pseudoterrestris]
MALTEEESSIAAAADTNMEPATLALALVSQDWRTIGLNVDDPLTAATSDTSLIIDRLYAILLIRLAAIVAPLGTFSDLSVYSVSSKIIKMKTWPDALTSKVRAQLHDFVSRIIKGYKNNHYHNQEHACHVTLSACKLMDLFLYGDLNDIESDYLISTNKNPSFGLRNDPLLLFVVVFSALIHDVEHQGLPNRQLAMEKDRLAVLYNDQSIAENWSLYVAFSELLQNDFTELRQAMFTYVAPLEKSAADADAVANDVADNQALDAHSQHSHQVAATTPPPPPSYDDLYQRFRRFTVNLVLATDIASPEKSQLAKSKWKEAFGDSFETVERKVRHEMRRASIGMTGKVIGSNSNRRGSNISDVSASPGLLAGAAAPANGDHNDDDSLSVTPEHSESDDLDVSHTNSHQQSPVLHQPQQRKVSMGYGPGAPCRFERRMSTSTSKSSSKYRQRLGIRRSMDLSGETIEAYQQTASSSVSSSNMNHHHYQSSGGATVYSVDVDSDLPDELKATVVMEAIMTASDVAHNLQGFEQMKKWSNKLYLELRKAYVAKRGVDCSPKVSSVFVQDNQLDYILLP